MIARSASFTRLSHGSSMSLDFRLSAMSRTIRPLALSWSATDCLDSASTSPRACWPPRSIALKTNVLIARTPCRGGRRGGRASNDALSWRCGEGRRAEQPAQLLRRRGTGLGELLRDLAAAHERRQRGVHRLHADARAGLQRGVDLVRLAL